MIFLRAEEISYISTTAMLQLGLSRINLACFLTGWCKGSMNQILVH